jgi:hypothetical protein
VSRVCRVQGLSCPGFVCPGFVCPGFVCPGFVCPGFVTTLLQNRAEVNCLGSKGLSPLHIAAAAGNSDIVAILFQNGADSTCLGQDRNSP